MSKTPVTIVTRWGGWALVIEVLNSDNEVIYGACCCSRRDVKNAATAIVRKINNKLAHKEHWAIVNQIKALTHKSDPLIIEI